MIKLKFLALCTVLVATLYSCTNNIEPVTIGAIFPLTGNYAPYGNYMRQGMELALNQAISEGLIKKGEITIVFEDSKAEPKLSVSAFQKLVSINKVVACVPATSAVTLALKPIANEDKVVLINATAISPEIESNNDYIFSIIPDADLEGKFLADVAYNKLSKRNAAIIYRNDQSGIAFYNSISTEFKSKGGNVIYSGAHEPNENNFSTQLLKIRQNEGIDVIFVMSFGTEVANFAKQAFENGVNIQLVSYETFNSPANLKISGNAANGLIFCSPMFNKDSKDSITLRIKNSLKNNYKQDEYNYFIASHYDASMLLIKAIASGNKSGKEIKDYLAKLEFYEGATGKIRFNEKGGAIVPLVLYEVVNNDFKVIP